MAERDERNLNAGSSAGDVAPERLMKVVRELQNLICDREDHLEACGLDVVELLAGLVRGRRALAEANYRHSQVQEAYLQALADQADAEREVFSEVTKLYERFSEAIPNDPIIQDLGVTLQKAGRHFPKD